MNKLKILFSNPSLDEDKLWLPYTWGRFREYCDKRSKHDLSTVEWLDPIYFGYWNDITEIEREYNLAEVDVVLLSMYVWNEDRNIKIAEMVKKANPNVVILAGGPHAQYKPWQDTSIYKGLIDWVTPWEGEEPLANFLHAKLNDLPVNESEWVDPKFPKEIEPYPRLELKNVQHSPYKLYKSDFERFANRIRNEKGWLGAIFESARGCPYNCSFCDWGSLTATKIKIYPVHVVETDFDIFSQLKVNYIFSMDANFGMFKQDLETIRHAIKLKQNTGWPKEVQFCANKNKKEISNQAFIELYDHGMNAGSQISFQHTDAEVLAAIDRANIQDAKLIEELELAYKHQIPMVGAVILGNPGDTVSKWKDNFNYLMEVGFHEDMRIHDFMLLPNAPAAHPDYIKKYGIKTSKRSDAGAYKITGEANLYYADFIESTNTFTKDDYVEMQTWTYFVMAVHQLNITRWLSMYCYQYHNISYRQFYDRLIELPEFKKAYNELYKHMKEWAYQERDEKSIRFKGLRLPPDMWLKCFIAEDMSGYTKDMQLIIDEFTDLEPLAKEDLVKTQLLSIVSWKKSNSFTLRYNFTEIFKQMYNNIPHNISKEYPVKKLNPRIGKIKNYIISNQRPTSIIDVIKGGDPRSWIESKANHIQNRRQGVSHYKEVFDL
jgi:putative methyltransferase